MKNYKVKAIMKFTDKEEDTKRIVDDEFFCTKERYEYLKSNGAVILIEIVDEIIDNVFAILTALFPNFHILVQCYLKYWL